LVTKQTQNSQSMKHEKPTCRAVFAFASHLL
jgi:hypothetical protein